MTGFARNFLPSCVHGASTALAGNISALQVQPELRFGAEPVPEAQGGVAGHGTLVGDDLADPPRP